MDTSKQKPDLMGKSGASPDGVKRILAHLEHGAKLPASKPARTAGWSIDGWTLGLAMMLLGMCCIAWLMHDGGSSTSGFTRSHGSSAPRYEATQEATQASTALERMPTALARADLPAPTPGASPEQAAAIINDPAAQVDAGLDARMRAAREAGLTNAFGLPAFKTNATAHTRSAATGATTDSAPAGASHANAGAVYPGTRAASSASTHPGVAGAGARYNADAGAGRTPAATHTPARSKAPSANDTDIALLAALVAHAGKPSVAIPERSRDIVERYDGDSTAELLARCTQLGVIEGMLCRSRICSGRWDSDPVCRAPAQ